MSVSPSFIIFPVSVGISYGDAPEKAIEVIREILNNIDGLDTQMKPQIGISSFGDSAIDIEYRVWLPADNYFTLLYQINLDIFNALNAAKINIPFPQREVRMVTDR